MFGIISGCLISTIVKLFHPTPIMMLVGCVTVPTWYTDLGPGASGKLFFTMGSEYGAQNPGLCG